MIALTIITMLLLSIITGYFFIRKQFLQATVLHLDFSERIDTEVNEVVFRLLCEVRIGGDPTQLPLIYSSVPAAADQEVLSKNRIIILKKFGARPHPVIIGTTLIRNFDFRAMSKWERCKTYFFHQIYRLFVKTKVKFLYKF